MNKRIKELAEQAFQPINDMASEGIADRYTFDQAWFQMYNEKFAELIVRECADIVEHSRIQGDESVCLVGATKNKIKQHFGVEE